MSEGTDRPVLRVLRGDATPEEIAAVLAIVLARTAGGSSAGPPGERQVAAMWGSSRHRSVRVSPGGRHVDAGMLSWRTSFWPR